MDLTNQAGNHKSGCLVCGAELLYSDDAEQRTCMYCEEAGLSSVACANGHYVCDACHSGSANDLIQRFCSASARREPVSMAITLMKDARVKMHGPEHHFLVPAVLLAAFCNTTGRERERAGLIAKARERAQEIKGGSCGFNGNCGAGVGTGIFVSLVTGATPLSHAPWRFANLMTAESLRVIAEHGGPRCCKRDSFLAILAAGDFLSRELEVALPKESVTCDFSALNHECLQSGCPFWAG
jgi:hypothetical protein